MTSSSYKMQDSAGTHHLLDSHFACFMYRSECQSKGVLHKHEVFIISDNIDMKEKEVQEKIFKKLEILRENNDEKVRKNIIFEEVVGNCYFHFKRDLMNFIRKFQYLKKNVQIKRKKNMQIKQPPLLRCTGCTGPIARTVSLVILKRFKFCINFVVKIISVSKLILWINFIFNNFFFG